MSAPNDAAVGVANAALAEAGLPGIHVLLAALNSTLWVLDHPEVNALKFCGNPKEQAKRIRELVDSFGDAKDRASKDCPTCRDSDSWGIADRDSCSACFGTPDGKGSLYRPLNGPRCASTAADLRQAAAQDTSCVGAFARARP